MECDDLCYCAPAPLTEESADEFRRRGGMILRNVLTAEEMDCATPALREYIRRKRELLTPAERDFGASAVKPIFSIADAPPPVRDFILSPTLGELAARALGVSAVRLLHFSGFYKADHAAPTPWHQDLAYLPLGGEQSVTIWIPLMDLSPHSGTLMFAEASHLDGREHRVVNDLVRFRQVRHDALRRGDVSLHLGWTLHCSMQNVSGSDREVVAISYYADGMRIQRKPYAFNEALIQSYFPGLGAGDLAAGPLNPIVYPVP